MKFSSFARQSPRFYLTVVTLGVLAACMGEETTTIRIGTGGAGLVQILVEIIGGDNQTAAVRNLLGDSLAIRVTASTGTPIGGAIVTWACTASRCSMNPATNTTTPNGVSKSLWRLGQTVGPQTATATVANVPSPITFNAVGVQGQPDAIRKTTGDFQTAKVGTVLPTPIGVLVVDDFENPLKDIVVHWIVVDTLDFFTKVKATVIGKTTDTISTTDINGNASTIWSLGPAAVQLNGLPDGRQTLKVTTPGTSVQIFTAITTATAAAASRYGFSVPSPRSDDGSGVVQPAAPVEFDRGMQVVRVHVPSLARRQR